MSHRFFAFTTSDTYELENTMKPLLSANRLIAIGIAVLCSSCLIVDCKAQTPLRPNIIVFLVDDYDKPETSPYGGKVLTPNLDRLANEGMMLHNAHVTSTVCTPSRYTYLTGRYASASTSEAFMHEFPAGHQTLPAFNMGLETDNRNVGQVLTDAGYVTGYVGKYHVHDGEEIEGLTPIAKNAKFSEELNRVMFENEKKVREIIKQRGFTWAKNVYMGNMKNAFKGHNPEWTIEAALEFVQQHKDQTFYLHCCPTLLHGPNREWYRSLTEKELMSGEGKLEKPVGLIDRQSVLKRIKEAGLTENEIGYLWMDDTLGLLLDKLDELKIADNTIVLFVSDHGSNKKGSVFKSRGTEIPCLVRWPKVIPAGTETDSLIQNTDFAATWFDVAGVEVSADYRMDGISMQSVFQDPKNSIRDFVYAEQGPARSIKTKDWSYTAIRYTADQVELTKGEQAERGFKLLSGLSGGVSRAALQHPGAFDSDQLYDLSADPNEQVNLANKPEHATRVQTMQKMLVERLKGFDGRPYGEFLPGGNAVTRSQTQAVLDILKTKSGTEKKKNNRKNRKNGNPKRK